MPILLSSSILPQSPTIPFLVQDIHLRGGYRCVNDDAERDSVPLAARKEGMRVFVASTDTSWTVGSDKSVWVEVPDGSARTAVSYTSPNPISPGGQVDFTLETGKASILLNVTVSDPDIKIEAHGLSARADVNPFTFISYAGHLTDDGTSKLEDSTLQYNRRYAILVNNEGTPSTSTYWRLTNNGPGTITPSVDITFLTVEK
jgi:hypothetical protein